MKLSIEERFWNKVNITDDENSCWEWLAGIDGRKTVKGKIYRTSYFYNPVLAKKELEKILP